VTTSRTPADAAVPPPAAEDLLPLSFVHRLARTTIVATQLYPGSRMGIRRSRAKGAGMEFADHKPYSPGDDFRAVDWNVFARTDHLYLKTFETEENLYVYVLVDVSGSMGFGSAMRKLEWGKRLAAALGYITLAQQDNLAVHAMNDALCGSVSTAAHRLKPSDLFAFCAGLTAGGQTDFIRCFQAFTIHTGHRGMVFLISDFLSDRNFDQGVRYLVYNGFGVLAFHLVDPWEEDPALEGEVDLEDSEAGSLLPLTVRRNTLVQMRECFEAHCERVRRTFGTYAARYFRIRTDRSVEKFVLEDLRHEGVVR
jgi:uncharacterized protein (DUF58 family)